MYVKGIFRTPVSNTLVVYIPAEFKYTSPKKITIFNLIL